MKYEDCAPDPERITEINHGDWQGTLLYVIAAKGYQPSTFYAVKVYYGSCSGCDSLQLIRSGLDYDYETETVTIPDTALDALMGLALNVVQGIKMVGD